MSPIDDAQTRPNGKPGKKPHLSLFSRLLPEGRGGRTAAGDARLDSRVAAAARQAVATRKAEASTPVARAWPEHELHPDQIFAIRQVLHYAAFTCRAVLRHKVLVIFAFLLTFSTIVVATRLVPRSYEIEVKMLAQRSSMMQSLSNPGRAVPDDADSPTRAAAETVLRRDNVISLIRQTDLVNAWERSRAPVLRTYDRWKAKLIGREPTMDEKLDNLVKQIETRMVVSSAKAQDGLVSIRLTWPDARSGYFLVEHAQQTFLDARRVAETQAIAESISVLEGYAKRLNQDIQVTLGELSRTQRRVLTMLPAAIPAPSRSSSVLASVLETSEAYEPSQIEDPLADLTTLNDPRLGRLKNSINAKRGELMRLESDQKRRLDQLDSQLSVARTIYTPNHPTVRSLQQNVAAFQHTSPQITMLRNEIDRLEMQADDQSALAAERFIRGELSRRGPAPPPPVRRQPRVASATAEAAPAAESDPAGLPRPTAVADLATLSLRTQLNQLRSILERTDAARIEFEVSKAAFKHRYSVVSPAEEPSKQSFPDTRRVVVAGLVASLVFALFAAIAADVLSNRVIEPWQLQQALDLPLLGTVKVS